METRAQMDFLARCRVGEVESGDRFSYYSCETPTTESILAQNTQRFVRRPVRRPLLNPETDAARANHA